MHLSHALLPEFDHEVATTRKVLERLPEDKFGYKPAETSMAAGRLASHIVEMGMWGSMTMSTAEFDMSPGGQSAYPPVNFTTSADLLAAFDKHMAETRSAIAKASNEDFAAHWTLKNNGHALMTMPKAAVIRTFVMNHIIHHRGQLSVYLRLLGVKIPSIYGPSADEAGF